MGLAAAARAALTGAAEGAELHHEQQWVGLVHALANTVAVGLYATSLACRIRGHTAAGRALGFLELTVVGAGGMLGGHMAYRQAAGANHGEEVSHVLGEGGHCAGAVADLPVGRPVRRGVDDVPVLLVCGTDGTIHALTDRCSHLAGPLSEGTVADGCLRCPWHGSVFRVSDGWNVRGPAAAPQHAFDPRVVDGHVEVRLRPPDHIGPTGEGDGTNRRTSETGTDTAHGHSS